jgi:hypothetical protein
VDCCFARAKHVSDGIHRQAALIQAHRLTLAVLAGFNCSGVEQLLRSPEIVALLTPSI